MTSKVAQFGSDDRAADSRPGLWRFARGLVAACSVLIQLVVVTSDALVGRYDV